MKTKFSAYLPGTQEWHSAWNDCFVVLDAGALLCLYRDASQPGYNDWEPLVNLRDRLWLPHQAALDFHRGRIAALLNQEKAFAGARNDLRKMVQVLQSATYALLPKRAFDKLNQVAEDLACANVKLEGLFQKDPVLTRVFELFDGKVGEPYSDDRLKEIQVQAEAGRRRRVPATDEPADDKHAALVTWHQLLDEAKTRRRPLLFVTDSSMRSWLLTCHDRVPWPHPELIQEMQATAQVGFHVCTLAQLMEHARKLSRPQTFATAATCAALSNEAPAALPVAKPISGLDDVAALLGAVANELPTAELASAEIPTARDFLEECASIIRELKALPQNLVDQIMEFRRLSQEIPEQIREVQTMPADRLEQIRIEKGIPAELCEQVKVLQRLPLDIADQLSQLQRVPLQTILQIREAQKLPAYVVEQIQAGHALPDYLMDQTRQLPELPLAVLRALPHLRAALAFNERRR